MGGQSLQTYPYVWFLTMFWFGRCRDWKADPLDYLPPESHHLLEDLPEFFPQIQQIYPRAHAIWNVLSDVMIERILEGIPRTLNLCDGLTDAIKLVATHSGVRRYVEIGGYEGGSILALGLRFLNRDIDFYCVESFMGNLDGSVDGYSLPSRTLFLSHLAKFPAIRVKLMPGDSELVAGLFGDRSVDFVFIDGCHDTPAVMRDINAWLPKIAAGGIIAGDDYGWPSVRRAIDNSLRAVEVTRSGRVWWKQLGSNARTHG